MHPFLAALEARDVDGAVALLADDVAFRSPIVFEPYHGRDALAPILSAAARVFDEFRYHREIISPDTRDHAGVFTARVGHRDLEGCDFVHVNEAGLIDELYVMVRPLSGALALAEAMRTQLAFQG